jgi:HK97 family phage portal protein
MQVDRDKNSGQIVYKYAKDDGPAVPLSQEDVLHIPGLGFDGCVGYSPIAMAKQAIGLSLATEEYGCAFFANGANPGGVLEHPGVVKNPEQLRESWYSQFGGSAKAHRIAVLEDGLKFHAIGIAPEAAQFLQTRKFQINEIARIFRVPPHMVGDLEKSSFSNIEQQSLEFVKYSIGPWVVRWEQALMQALLLPLEKQELFIRFNLDGLLRGDYQSRMQGYATARQNGWMSANDIRSLEDQNLIPAEEGGDAYLVNGNMISIVTAQNSVPRRRDIELEVSDEE